MKMKVGIVVIVALVLAQLIFGGRRSDKDAPVAEPVTVGAAEVVVSRPKSADVVRVAVEQPGQSGEVLLEKTGAGWALRQPSAAPANAARINRLVNSLLTADLSPVPEGITAEQAGLASGQGVRLTMTTADGKVYAPVIGLHPEGSFDTVYIALPEGGMRVLAADVRAMLGLWKNQSATLPSPDTWLDTTVMRFDPAKAVAVEATYPDHRIAFAKDAAGEWQVQSGVPGGEWSREGLDAWLRDLSAFRVSGIADAGQSSDSGMHRPDRLYSISVTFDDGDAKTVSVSPDNADDGAVAYVSSYPGYAFILPEWRFTRYFRRLADLFPKATPNFNLPDIRFIDIRRGGESVKIMRTESGEWNVVALPYQVRLEQLERLVRLLASWRPEDFADPDGKSMRPAYGGPMTEVILARGEVHQYRLAGRHPWYPWRYVTVDGESILCATDSEVGVMFPEIADILDFGPVFPNVSSMDLSEITVTRASDGSVVTLERSPEGEWTAAVGTTSVPLARKEGDKLADELLSWRIAGVHEPERQGQSDVVYGISVVVGGEKMTRTFSRPTERDVPFATEGGRSYMVDRADFLDWIGDVKGVVDEVHQKALAGVEAVEEEEKMPAEEEPVALSVEAVATEAELSPEEGVAEAVAAAWALAGQEAAVSGEEDADAPDATGAVDDVREENGERDGVDADFVTDLFEAEDVQAQNPETASEAQPLMAAGADENAAGQPGQATEEVVEETPDTDAEPESAIPVEETRQRISPETLHYFGTVREHPGRRSADGF